MRIVFALACLLAAAALPVLDVEQELEVTLRIFSGSEDPRWVLSPFEAKAFRSQFSSVFTNKPSPTFRVLGYRGFVVSPVNSTIGQLVLGHYQAEKFLLETIPAELPASIVEHVLEVIDDAVAFPYQQCIDHQKTCDAHIPCCGGLACSCTANLTCTCQPNELEVLSNAQSSKCEDIVRGPDGTPVYDPKNDDEGCFVSDCSYNNCYNYGNDIVTDTFAQPGRGSGQKWSSNTCEDIRASAERDGLVWAGTTLPTEAPEKGHYVALFIWPGTNFHWARLDSNGQWSHKPGGTPVKDTDNTGSKITDPAECDLSPWSEFCGYMTTIPSEVNIG